MYFCNIYHSIDITYRSGHSRKEQKSEHRENQWFYGVYDDGVGIFLNLTRNKKRINGDVAKNITTILLFRNNTFSFFFT